MIINTQLFGTCCVHVEFSVKSVNVNLILGSHTYCCEFHIIRGIPIFVDSSKLRIIKFNE